MLLFRDVLGKKKELMDISSAGKYFSEISHCIPQYPYGLSDIKTLVKKKGSLRSILGSFFISLKYFSRHAH